MQALAGNDIKITSPVFTDADEAPAAAASVALVVTDALGNELASPTPAAEPGTPGIYSATLTAADHTGQVDQLSLLWTGTVDGLARSLPDDVEVVGGFYLSLAELRAIPDVDAYTSDEIRAARAEFEQIAETYLDRAFVPRVAVDHLTGDGCSMLWPTRTCIRSVRSVTVNGTAVDLSTVSVNQSGLLVSTRAWPRPLIGGAPNVVAVYEYGEDRAPAPVVKAEGIYVRSELRRLTAGFDRDAIWQSSDGVVNRYSTPDMAAGRPTGYLDPDRLLNSVRAPRRHGIA